MLTLRQLEHTFGSLDVVPMLDKRNQAAELLGECIAKTQQAKLDMNAARATYEEVVALHLLQTQVVAELRAVLSPIRTISSQTLELILLFAVAGGHSPWKLSHVCSRWLNVARTTPELWTELVIPVSFGAGPGASRYINVDHFRLALQRTGNAPLHVVFCHHPFKTNEARTTTKSIEDILDIVGGTQFERWLTLKLHRHPKCHPAEMFAYFKGAQLRTLHTLEVSFEPLFFPNLLLVPDALPSLRNLSIVTRHLCEYKECSFWPQLTTLSISYPFDPYLLFEDGGEVLTKVSEETNRTALFSILFKCKALEYLELRGVTVACSQDSGYNYKIPLWWAGERFLPPERDIADRFSTRLYLSRLRSLTLLDCKIKTPFQLPRLETLRLSRTSLAYVERLDAHFECLTELTFSPFENILHQIHTPALQLLRLTGRPPTKTTKSRGSNETFSWDHLRLPAYPPRALHFVNCTISGEALAQLLPRFPQVEELCFANLVLSKKFLRSLKWKRDGQFLCDALSTLRVDFPLVATKNRKMYEGLLKAIARARGKALSSVKCSWQVDGEMQIVVIRGSR